MIIAYFLIKYPHQCKLRSTWSEVGILKSRQACRLRSSTLSKKLLLLCCSSILGSCCRIPIICPWCRSLLISPSCCFGEIWKLHSPKKQPGAQIKRCICMHVRLIKPYSAAPWNTRSLWNSSWARKVFKNKTSRKAADDSHHALLSHLMPSWLL